MTAPEIRATLDNWLWALSRDRTQAPPPEALALLRQHWGALRPTLHPKYHVLIDARLAMVDGYIAADTMRQARERLTNR